MATDTVAAARLFLQVAQGDLEVTLRGLADQLLIGESMGSLGRAVAVAEFVTQHEMILTPGLEEGDPDSARVLRFKAKQATTEQALLSEIGKGEGQSAEFKSSLLYDHKKAAGIVKAGGTIIVSDLRSEEVIHSALKTVCAFLNSGGGRVYIGVGDDQSVIGLAHDYSILGPNASDDKWQLTLKDLIGSRFKDGKVTNDYVSVAVMPCAGLPVARLTVAGRAALSFLRDRVGTYSCYSRQGNRTVAIEITEFEEFLDRRRKEMGLQSRY